MPPGLLGVYTRNVVRRMNLGRVRARQGRDKEAMIHLHQVPDHSPIRGHRPTWNIFSVYPYFLSPSISTSPICHANTMSPPSLSSSQALQDSRMLGKNSLQAHVVLYAQCLAAVADTHLDATLRTVRGISSYSSHNCYIQRHP